MGLTLSNFKGVISFDEKRFDPDQLAACVRIKPPDLNLHCYQNRKHLIIGSNTV